MAEEIKFDERTWKRLFPQDIIKLSNDKLSSLRLTNIGTYSISLPDISKKLIEIIDIKCAELKIKNPTILETNGGLGGFTIRLANKFNQINVVEIDPLHAEIIANNIKVYGLDKKSNINIHTADYLDIMDSIKTDIIISDPPWGGRDYRKQKYIKLHIGSRNIVDVINHTLSTKLCKMFILFAPVNFDMIHFIKNIRYKTLGIYDIGKHKIISIE
jgi:16S rRNA G966 N2-methylase RsmD